MSQADLLILIVVGGAGGVSVLAMLGVFANIIRYETQLHALRNRVSSLQFDYALRVARLQGQIGEEEGGFEILDDGAEQILPGELGGVEVGEVETAAAA